MTKTFKRCTNFNGFTPDMNLINALARYNTPAFLADLFFKYSVDGRHIMKHVLSHFMIHDHSLVRLDFDLRDGSLVGILSDTQNIDIEMLREYQSAWRTHVYNELKELMDNDEE